MQELTTTSMSVRLPPHRDIPMSTRVASVIDHPVFQRLRRVRQLGPLSLIYPGATHTRFEHSVGVYGLVLDYLRALLQDERADVLTEQDLETCMLAGLLHDLGHYPFAHSLETSHTGALRPPRHEELAADLIYGRLAYGSEQHSALASLIEQHFTVTAEDVIALISKPSHAHATPGRRLAASVISSGMDADKSDYLERDAHHMGLPYGEQFDRARMLSTMVIHPHGDQIALSMRGRMAAESFVFARYSMFSEAYWHHTARAVSAMVEEALRDIQRDGAWGQDSLKQDIITQDDTQFLDAMHVRAKTGSAADALLSRLRAGQRQLHKRVLTLTLAFAEPSLRTAYDRLYVLSQAQIDTARTTLRGVVQSIIGRKLETWELLIDTPPRDKDKVESIAMVRGGIAQPLAYSSQIVRGIETDFIKVVKKIRVFVSPEVREALLQKMSRAALEERFVDAILHMRIVDKNQPDLFHL